MKSEKGENIFIDSCLRLILCSVAIERVLDSAAAILRAIDSIQVTPALFVKSLHLMTLFLDRSAYLPFLSVWDPDALASLIIHCFDCW